MADVVFIPFRKSLYDDLVRLSDGRCNPAEVAEARVIAWIDQNMTLSTQGGWADDDFASFFDDRSREVAEKYAPWVLEEWDRAAGSAQAAHQRKRQPLVWKEITVPTGSEVRMPYGGTLHYATVGEGKIVDKDGAFSPSEWASKVAGWTSRNAWRDIWFKLPTSSQWMPATLMRETARAAREASADETLHEILAKGNPHE